jgi:hypothetical protein
MAPIRRRMAVVGSVALASLAVLAQPAAANHEGAIVDCGSAGTFTLATTPTGAGFGAPGFTSVLLFEEGGTLNVMKASFDGVVVFDPAAVGRSANAVEETTCSFTLRNGVDVEITGVLTDH